MSNDKNKPEEGEGGIFDMIKNFVPGFDLDNIKSLIFSFLEGIPGLGKLISNFRPMIENMLGFSPSKPVDDLTQRAASVFLSGVFATASMPANGLNYEQAKSQIVAALEDRQERGALHLPEGQTVETLAKAMEGDIKKLDSNADGVLTAEEVAPDAIKKLSEKPDFARGLEEKGMSEAGFEDTIKVWENLDGAKYVSESTYTRIPLKLEYNEFPEEPFKKDFTAYGFDENGALTIADDSISLEELKVKYFNNQPVYVEKALLDKVPYLYLSTPEGRGIYLSLGEDVDAGHAMSQGDIDTYFKRKPELKLQLDCLVSVKDQLPLGDKVGPVAGAPVPENPYLTNKNPLLTVTP